jgi:type IV pilus assembly protein PilC
MALTFEYKVRDRAGRLVEGSLEGDSMALVVGKLREMGYMPISVTPKSKVALNAEIHIPGLTDRVKLAEIAVATRQLATMIDSGLSVVRALSVLSGQVDNKELSRVLNEVRLDVERGSSLSAALSKHPKVFSELFVTMVQAGEVGGNLDTVLLDLATTMEKQAALMRAIRGAMTYPAVVMCVMCVIFLALLIFIVPIFKNLFATLHATLPVPTLLIIKVSNIILSWRAIIVVAFIVGGIFAFRHWIATEKGRAIWDRAKLRPPIFGPLMHKTAIARFSGTLASLVSSGVPILESLDIVSETAGNVAVGSVLQAAKQGVREGRPFADVLKEHEDIIPNLVVQMVEVGEQTGALDNMLRKVADFYDGEVEATVNNLTNLLEPLLTVFMGAGVGVMVIAMYLPMFTYIQHIPQS